MILHANATLLSLLTAAQITIFALRPSSSPAATRPTSVQDPESVPHLRVRVYSSVKALSLTTVAGAESEADRILRKTHLALSWVNCLVPSNPAFCRTPERATDLILRVSPGAFPQVKANALGMSMWSPLGSSAVLFYDRIAAHRTYDVFAYRILGSAFAHEIVHLLLPAVPHTDLGLMRTAWQTDDLKLDNLARLVPSEKSIQLIQAEALRRMRLGENTSRK